MQSKKLFIQILVTCYLTINFYIIPATAAEITAYKITEFGAIGDGKTLNTEIIQAAIDSVSKSGGGEILFPAGKYLTGSLILKDGVNLVLEEEAVMLGSSNPYHYKGMDKIRKIIFSKNR